MCCVTKRYAKAKTVQKIHILCNSRTCAGGHAQTRNVGPSSPRILGGSGSGCGIGGRMPRARGGRQPPLLLLRRLLPYSCPLLAAAGRRPLLHERLDARSSASEPKRGGGQEGRRPGPLGLGHGLDIFKSDERIRMFVAIFNLLVPPMRQRGASQEKRRKDVFGTKVPPHFKTTKTASHARRDDACCHVAMC